MSQACKVWFTCQVEMLCACKVKNVMAYKVLKEVVWVIFS